MTPTETGQRHADLCASYQEAAIDQLVKKSVSFLKIKNTGVLVFLVVWPIIKFYETG